jgi:hypothetical protein
MTAPWDRVKAGLVAAGVMDERGNTRRARARICQRCHAKVIVGFDADRAATLAIAEPTPLTALGEVLALVAGRQTWALEDRGRMELNYRDAWRISSTPAESRPTALVLPEHRCGDSSLEPFAAANTLTKPTAATLTAPPY